MGEFSAGTPAVRHLFGGAMALAAPDRLVDVSAFRPVPDHQEERSCGL